eukprot:3814018-Rhodomonas_salina.1
MTARLGPGQGMSHWHTEYSSGGITMEEPLLVPGSRYHPILHAQCCRGTATVTHCMCHWHWQRDTPGTGSPFGARAKPLASRRWCTIPRQIAVN